MEGDFGRVDLDESWILPDEDPPAIVIDPPREAREPRPPGPRRLTRQDAEVGPWFPAAMGVLLVWGLLCMLAMSVRATGGTTVAFALSGVFGLIYLGFFVAGSLWFGKHRRGR